MTTPDEAVEAAFLVMWRALHPGKKWTGEWTDDAIRLQVDITAALTAAEPHIEAAALEAASMFVTNADVTFRNLDDVRDWLRERAATINPKEQS